MSYTTRSSWLTYLICLLFLSGARPVAAQSIDAKAPLLWYVPQPTGQPPREDGPGLITYTSWADLAQKVAQRPDQPFHLHLTVRQPALTDWQVLRQLPSPTKLVVELIDSTLNERLLPIMAGWASLQSLNVGAEYRPRSYTMVPDGKGGQKTISETTFLPTLPQTGWDRLTSVRELTLSTNLNVRQALSQLSRLPALESLTLYLWDTSAELPTAADWALLPQLRELTVNGFDTRPDWLIGLGRLTNLRKLTFSSGQLADMNALFTSLQRLETLDLDYVGPADRLPRLRLAALPALQSLHLSRYGKEEKAVDLDSTLAGVTTLRHLTLDGIRLAALPRSLLANPQLVTLSLVDCELTALPESLDNLTRLEELHLDRNPLQTLPALVGRLTRLRQLSLDRCELTELPATLGQLGQLTYLTATQNHLTRLPESLGQLRQLRDLNVSMNDLTDLPGSLRQLPALERLAAFTNQLTRFPVELAQVRHLYLSDNQLTNVPDAVGELRRLRSLTLAGNPLTSLPETIGQLDSLEMLTLGDNQLTALPQRIGQLSRLSWLELGNNRLRELPESIGSLTSLTAVVIGNNPLEILPASVGGWQRLRTASLQLPYLRRLPDQIGNWQQLEDLTIESDQLVLLPDALTDCRSLTVLTLSGNKLIGLPERMGKLTRLRQLVVSARSDSTTGSGLGRLTNLPADLVNCPALTDLTVQQQQAFDGGDALRLSAALPRLQTLSFINCGITDLSGIVWSKLSLVNLNLMQNRLSQLPNSLLDMPNLTQINLADNNLPPQLNRFFRPKSELAKALAKAAE
ncbi:Protein LAP2 Erbb2-interacting protein [Fibrella aestuarina BUZ 2]|uniref:Protein LAP2 Erbb2-interacting protein n=1 Tax=Fibrella aestuarina BUZ 2 TaxID=1166018 RepID=I0KBH4_9BACT|nr:protein LAP2 Erbb2-interacting protein [Fibrella aestuarina]CCH01477.1 Protein LAP2 Erbb2-interacting protein [Fibrella aestuarina BUZ 2]